METHATDTTPAYWDNSAEHYSRELAPLGAPFAEAALRLTGTRAGHRVLDVATGPGPFALAAARAGAEVVAVDFAPLMIAELRRRALDEGLVDLRADVMDGQALTLPDESFDVAVSLFGVIFFPDRAAGCRERYRVLRPGGVAQVAGWGTGGYWPTMPGTRAIAQTLPEKALARGQQAMAAPDVFADALRAVGFPEVRTETIAQRAWVGMTAHEVWEMVQEWPYLLHLDREEREALRPAFFAALRERSGDGPIAFNRVAHLAVGTK